MVTITLNYHGNNDIMMQGYELTQITHPSEDEVKIFSMKKKGSKDVSYTKSQFIAVTYFLV